MSLIYTFLQILMQSAPHLQDAMHGMRSPLQLHRFGFAPSGTAAANEFLTSFWNRGQRS